MKQPPRPPRRTLLVLSLLGFLSTGCCKSRLGGTNPPPPLKAGPPPQVPIDSREVLWTTIVVDGEHPGTLGYLLTVGVEVLTFELETSKGIVTVSPGSEQWFSASNDQHRGKLGGATSIKWSSENVAGIETASDGEPLAVLIEGATALVSSSTALEPSVTGPSGTVEWNELAGLPTEVKSFQFPSLGTEEQWYLSLAAPDGAFTNVLWSTNKEAGTYTLPGRFGEPGSFEMALVEADAITTKAAFTGYEYH